MNQFHQVPQDHDRVYVSFLSSEAKICVAEILERAMTDR